MRHSLAGACLTGALLLAGCDRTDPVAARPSLVLRGVCGLQRWLERNDFRVRAEGVDRCAGAARQMEASGERARRWLEGNLEPNAAESQAAAERSPEASPQGP